MSNEPIKELLSSSSLAFTGTVETVRATTVSDVLVNDRTVVVEVGEVLLGTDNACGLRSSLSDLLACLPACSSAACSAA
jgi:hypothetical protein